MNESPNLEKRKDIYIIYDQVGHASTDGPEKKELYRTLRSNLKEDQFALVTQKSLFRPPDIDNLKAFLYKLFLKKDSINVHPIIVSGLECGCRYFYDLLEFYDLHENVLFMGDDIVSRANTVRLMREPAHKNKNLGFSEFADDWFKENYDENITEELLKNIDIPEKKETVKNRVSIVAEPHVCVRFAPLKMPCEEYPLAIKRFLEEKYKDNFKNLEILWHCHPGERDRFDSLLWKTDLIGLPVTIKYGKTAEEAAWSETIVGWDSTFLLKTFYAGMDTYTLKEEGVLNFTQDNFLLSSKINACTFNTSSYEDLVETEKTYRMLSEPADLNNPIRSNSAWSL